MARFRNIVVEVPPEARAVASTGRVYIVTERIYLKDRQYNEDKRIDIGWLNDTSGKTMNPNNHYAELYPLEFSKASKGKIAPITKRVGLFTFGLAFSEDNGLYRALIDGCGPDNANSIMDFALYSIFAKTNVAKDFSVIMKNQVLFGDKLRDDSWYSDFFNNQISSEMIDLFRENWVKQCIAHGLTEVWLCIDGSNNDCYSEDVEYAEQGNAKSHKNVNIYSYMYAVSIVDGTPVTYRLYRGGRVDSKAFLDIISYLRSYGIGIAGVNLDRAFCTIDCFELINSCKYDYVIKIKENFHGFNEMVKQYGNMIKMNAEYAIGNGLYAICGECQVFSKYNLSSHMVLVYDSVNGTARANYLSDKVLEEIERLEKLTEGSTITKLPAVNPKYAKYISGSIVLDKVVWRLKETATPTEEQTIKINKEIKRLQKLSATVKDVRDLPVVAKAYKKFIENVIETHVVWRRETERLQKAMDEKGFYVLAYSIKGKEAKAVEVVDTYGLRDTSEKQYMILGYNVSRSHTTEGTNSRHLCGFVAGIIRNDFRLACKQVNYDLNIAIREMNFLCIQRLASNEYTLVHNANERQGDLLKCVDLIEDDMNCVATLESQRANNRVFDQEHKIAHRSLRKKPESQDVTETKSEEAEPEKNEDSTPKKKRGGGRPKGSKNKKPAVNAKEKRREEKAKVSEDNQPS